MGTNIGGHADQTRNDGIHGPISWVFANAAARAAFTPTEGLPSSSGDLDADDLYKFAVDADTRALYWLTTITPSRTWTAVGNDALNPDRNKVVVTGLKNTAGSLPKGTLIYIAEPNGVSADINVEAAQANSAATLPCIGMANATITDSTPGDIIVVGGVVGGIDTSGTAVGDPIYVSPTVAGGWTTTPPAPFPIQPVGVIQKVDAVDGEIAFAAQSYRALSLAAPTTVATTASAGVSAEASRADHVHALPGNLPADTVDFSLGAAPAHAEGRVFYDTTWNCLAVYNDEADVTLQVGQESWLPVYNDTGQSIPNGSVVYISGADAGSGLPEITLARADATATSQAVGIATHNIPAGSTGYITTNGIVHDLDTSGFTVGDTLYLSATTAGELTNTAPTAPNATVRVGYALDSTAVDGHVYVSVNGIPGLPRVAHVSSADTTAGYLESKIVAGANITINKLSPGGNEQLQIVGTSTPLAGTAPVNVTKATAVVGVSTAAARADHKHDISTAAAVTILAGASNSEGTATTLSRSDHVHQLGLSGAPAACSAAAASSGSSSLFVRGDHTHQITTGVAPVAITDSTNAEGTSNSLARADHQHSHGTRGGGTLHAAATTSVAGFLSPADKTFIDSIVNMFALRQATATADATRSIDSYAVITGMTLTPPAGTYKVEFSSSGRGAVGAGDYLYAIFSGGTIVQHSERQLNFDAGSQSGDQDMAMHSQAVVTVNGSQAIEVHYRSNNGNFTVHERSMILTPALSVS